MMVKNSKKLRLAGWALLGIAGLGVLVAALFYGLYYYLVYDDHSDLYQTTDMTPVTHKIGGRTFVIPKAYITYWRDWEPNDENEFLTMKALLPDMTPFNGDNADKFDPRHPDKLEVDMNLSYVLDGWPPDYGWIAVDNINQCTEMEAGFLVCPGRFPIDDVLVRGEDKNQIKFKCDGIGNVPNPHCEAYLPLVANVKMSLRYHRNLMVDTDQIVGKAYRLVCGFFRPEPGVDLEFDNCSNGVYFDPSPRKTTGTQQ